MPNNSCCNFEPFRLFLFSPYFDPKHMQAIINRAHRYECKRLSQVSFLLGTIHASPDYVNAVCSVINEISSKHIQLWISLDCAISLLR